MTFWKKATPQTAIATFFFRCILTYMAENSWEMCFDTELIWKLKQTNIIQILRINLLQGQGRNFMYNTKFVPIFCWYRAICSFYDISNYRVFINEWNEALAYNFGQMASYDLWHVAKVSYIYDILIFGF